MWRGPERPALQRPVVSPTPSPPGRLTGVSIWRDLRYAARSLRCVPGFTMVAVVVLAIGIGANSAMFSLVDAALVAPFPSPSPTVPS